MSTPDPLHPLEQFKKAASALLPGIVAYFDFADCKRRSIHLGHMVIDEDIAEFDGLLRASVCSSGYARRVGGDRWLAIYPEGALPIAPEGAVSAVKPVLSQVLDEYHKERAILIGWRCKGCKDGAVEIVEQTVDTTITRSVRCAYFSATSEKDMNEAIDVLIEKRQTFPPGRPIPTLEIGSHEQISWRCVDAYPETDPYCPFCKGRDFEWEDGDSCVYSGSGTCKQCQADIDIRGVER